MPRLEHVTIQLLKPYKGTTVTYEAELLLHDKEHLLVHARWRGERLELGPLSFETGDHFYEHYYTDRWFNIFEVRNVNGALKGWYCNVTRPARRSGNVIHSEDLELDLVVSTDRRRVVTLDVDEFDRRFPAAAGHPEREPALAALEELRAMAHRGATPFNSTQTQLSLGIG